MNGAKVNRGMCQNTRISNLVMEQRLKSALDYKIKGCRYGENLVRYGTISNAGDIIKSDYLNPETLESMHQ
jgi:hypothetical protein